MPDYLDTPSAIDEVFASWGSTEAQRQDAVAVLARDFTEQNGAVIHKETGKPIEDTSVREFYTERKPHLLPPKFERSLADRAFLDSNITARGQLAKEIGEVAATRLAQSYGLRGLADTRRGTAPATGDDDAGKKNDVGKTNPWSAHADNVDKHGRYTAAAMGKQSSIVRSLGAAKGAELASAAGTFIGSTGPARRRA